MRIQRALPCALAIAAIAGGCGGAGGSTTAGGGAPLSARAEFVKQGDALCARSNEAMLEEAERKFAAGERAIAEGRVQGGKAVTAREVDEEVTRKVYASGIGRQASQISSLSVPAGDEARVRAIIRAIKRGVRVVENDPGTYGHHAFAEATRLARAYGFFVCGSE